MIRIARSSWLAAVFCVIPGLLNAQFNFTLGGIPSRFAVSRRRLCLVQSEQYLTINSSSGSGALTNGGGPYNDTQDMEFPHTWALLPQSLYPLDLRTSSIAHTGGDIYGQVALRKLGSIAYTAYAGTRSDDPYDGYHFYLRSNPAGLKPTTNMLVLRTGSSF